MADRLRNTVLPKACADGTRRFPRAPTKKAEKMRSQLFGFLRILAIRVVFEANSMGLR